MSVIQSNEYREAVLFLRLKKESLEVAITDPYAAGMWRFAARGVENELRSSLPDVVVSGKHVKGWRPGIQREQSLSIGCVIEKPEVGLVGDLHADPELSILKPEPFLEVREFDLSCLLGRCLLRFERFLHNHSFRISL